MRIVLKLKLYQSNLISANYHYAFSAAIYKLLHFGSSEFSQFLHNIGYKLNGKPYKLFNFALRFNDFSISKDIFYINDKIAYLYISSPLVEEFVKNFVIGTFKAKQFEIMSNNVLTKFSIEQAEMLPEPNFKNTSKFIMLSPLVLSGYKPLNGTIRQYYYRYDDKIEEIEEKINNNLFNKYYLIMNEKYSGEGVKFKWDLDYINYTLKKKKQIKKRVLILKDISNPISLIGMQAPFTLSGDTELMKIGYATGLGEKNSMGLGMIELV